METGKKDISIVLADDHPLMRKGLKDLIEEQEGWHVAAEAADGEEALEQITKFPNAILIIDIEMPRLNGLEVIKVIQKKNNPIKIIVLTMHEKENMFNRAMDLGVMGYVLKDSAATEIIDAIRIVNSGKYYISASISSFLVKRGQYHSDGGKDELGMSKLTVTERKILKLISREKSTKEIASELFISVRTVETHRANICQKLDLHGTNSLLKFALQHNEML